MERTKQIDVFKYIIKNANKMINNNFQFKINKINGLKTTENAHLKIQKIKIIQ